MPSEPEAARLRRDRCARVRSCRVVRSRLLVASLVASCAAANAADSALQTVVITATREPEALGRSSADVVVIDSSAIRDSGADSVEDLVRRLAGMQVVRNGGPGQSAGYLLRGASTNGTVVLVDGVRVGSATLGQAEFEALGLGQIDRVEVLRGPASSLYGADAVGGVVQIFTRRGAGPLRWSAGADVGGYRSSRADAGASGANGPWDVALSLGHEESRGVSAVVPNDAFGNFNPDRDGFRRESGTGQLGFTPAPGHRIGVHVFETHLHSRYDSSEFPPPTFVPDPTPDFRNALVTRVASVDYRGSPVPGWTTTVRGSRAVDDLTSGGNMRTRFVTRRDQATWQNAVGLAEGQQLLVALEHQVERASAEAFGEQVRRNNAGVLGFSGSLGKLSLQADVRRDDNSAYGANTTGRVGASVEVLRGVKLRALAGSTFRAPTFNDLAYPGFGVKTIQPERGRSVEAGASWQGNDASVSATVYRNRVRDLIVFEPDRSFCPPDPLYDFGCAANVGRATLQGATFAATARWNGFDVRANVDLLDAVDADTGVRLPRRAAHQESIGVDYEQGAWRAGAAALFVGARPDTGVVLGGYGVVGVRVAWRPRPTWRIEARLDNAFDRRIEPARDYRGLGRQAWLGVRFDSAGL
jgi:vitamin B12 transporter